MDLPNKAIRRFRHQLAMRLFLRYVLPLATVWGFAWGVAVLALRATAGVERKPLLWGLTGVAVCAAIAVARTWQHMPAVNVLRALLDEQSGCGGLLMAGAERELGGWRHELPPLRLPRVQWDGRRAFMLAALAMGFVVLAFLAPRGLADLTPRAPLEIDREIARLIEQIALLKGESILTPERAEMFEEKLAELRERSSGKDPARTLEALDHLRNLAGEAAREAAEKQARRGEHLGEAEALAEALRQGAALLSPRLKQEMLSELTRLLDKSGLDLKQVADNIDPETMKRLAEALRDGKIDLASQVEKMHKAGLIDAELLSKCLRAGECDSENPRALLRKGKGKIGRGPGAAPLTWGKPGSEDGYKFKEEVLPPGALASLKSSPLTVPGERVGQKVQHQRGGPTSSGALNGAAAGGGSANTEILLPRHRAAVERYFERQPPSQK